MFKIHKDTYIEKKTSHYKRLKSPEYDHDVNILYDSKTAVTNHLVPSQLSPEKDTKDNNLKDFFSFRGFRGKYHC